MLISKLNISVFALAAVALCSCEPNVQDKPEILDGYGGLTLGSTFEEAMSVASASAFNPYGIKKCLEEMPIKGCFLSPKDDLSIFRQVQGIPYTLQLDFNRLGALTDITLLYSRGSRYDEARNMTLATITEAQCADILERTIDWVVKDYGRFQNDAGEETDEVKKTTAGNLYTRSPSTDKKGFHFADKIKMGEGRMVTVFAHYLLLDEFGPDCGVDVSFEEPDTIERRPTDIDL